MHRHRSQTKDDLLAKRLGGFGNPERFLSRQHWGQHHAHLLPSQGFGGGGERGHPRFVGLFVGPRVHSGHRWHVDSVLGMHELPAVADFVGDPEAIDRGIGTRLEPVHRTFGVLDREVVATGGQAVDGWGLGQEPHPLFKQEVFVQQSTHGTQVHHVRAEFVVEPHAREHIDLLGSSTTINDQFPSARDLLGEADTAGAHDAAVGIQQDMLANILLGRFDLGFKEAAFGSPVLVGVVLQVALARLVAHRAIHRVVDQQVLHNGLLVADGLGRISVYHHALTARRLARGHQLGPRFQFAVVPWIGRPDFPEADSTVGHHRKRLVPAIVRDGFFVGQGHLKDGLTLLEVTHFAIDCQLGHTKGPHGGVLC